MEKNGGLSDRELQDAAMRRAAGESSLACEGLLLSHEQKERFRYFETARLAHQDCTDQIVAHYRALAQKRQG